MAFWPLLPKIMHRYDLCQSYFYCIGSNIKYAQQFNTFKNVNQFKSKELHYIMLNLLMAKFNSKNSLLLH